MQNAKGYTSNSLTDCLLLSIVPNGIDVEEKKHVKQRERSQKLHIKLLIYTVSATSSMQNRGAQCQNVNIIQSLFLQTLVDNLQRKTLVFQAESSRYLSLLTASNCKKKQPPISYYEQGKTNRTNN